MVFFQAADKEKKIANYTTEREQTTTRRIKREDVQTHPIRMKQTNRIPQRKDEQNQAIAHTNRGACAQKDTPTKNLDKNVSHETRTTEMNTEPPMWQRNDIVRKLKQTSEMNENINPIHETKEKEKHILNESKPVPQTIESDSSDTGKNCGPEETNQQTKQVTTPMCNTINNALPKQNIKGSQSQIKDIAVSQGQYGQTENHNHRQKRTEDHMISIYPSSDNDCNYVHMLAGLPDIQRRHQQSENQTNEQENAAQGENQPTKQQIQVTINNSQEEKITNNTNDREKIMTRINRRNIRHINDHGVLSISDETVRTERTEAYYNQSRKEQHCRNEEHRMRSDHNQSRNELMTKSTENLSNQVIPSRPQMLHQRPVRYITPTNNVAINEYGHVSYHDFILTGNSQHTARGSHTNRRSNQTADAEPNTTPNTQVNGTKSQKLNESQGKINQAYQVTKHDAQTEAGTTPQPIITYTKLLSFTDVRCDRFGKRTDPQRAMNQPTTEDIRTIYTPAIQVSDMSYRSQGNNSKTTYHNATSRIQNKTAKPTGGGMINRMVDEHDKDQHPIPVNTTPVNIESEPKKRQVHKIIIVKIKRTGHQQKNRDRQKPREVLNKYPVNNYEAHMTPVRQALDTATIIRQAENRPVEQSQSQRNMTENQTEKSTAEQKPRAQKEIGTRPTTGAQKTTREDTDTQPELTNPPIQQRDTHNRWIGNNIKENTPPNQQQNLPAEKKVQTTREVKKNPPQRKRKKRKAKHRTRRRTQRGKGKSTLTQRGRLRLGYINIAGDWDNKEQEVKVMMEDEDLDIIGIGETLQSKKLDMEGYTPYNVSKRKDFRGLCTFVKSELQPIELGELETGITSPDLIWIGIGAGLYKQAILMVYFKSGDSKEAKLYNKDLMDNIAIQVENLKNNKWQVIIMGDMNGHIGKMVPENNPQTNATGRAIKQLITSQDLRLVNGTTKCTGTWTWHRGNQKSIIDLILVSQQNFTQVTKMQIDEENAHNFPSDHALITLQLECLRPQKKYHQQSKTVWNITPDTNWRAFQNTLELLLQQEEWENLDKTHPDRLTAKAQYISDKLNEAAIQTIGIKRTTGQGKRQKQIPKYVWSRIRSRKRAAQVLRLARRMKVSREVIQLAQNELERKAEAAKKAKAEYKRKKKQITAEKIIKEGKLDQAKFWRYMRSKRRDNNWKITLTTETNRITRDKELKEYITTHYKDLFAQTQPSKDQRKDARAGSLNDRILDQPFTNEELQRQIKTLQRRKAAGLDKIPNEFILEGGPVLHKHLLEVYNIVRETETFYHGWSKSRTTLLHKKGRLDKLDNYRGITVDSVIGKLLTKLICHRLTNDVEIRNLLGNIQHGFRKGWRTADALYILTQIIDTRKIEREPTRKRLAGAFLDLKKAYDSVNRDILWETMESLGYGGKTLRIIKGMYTNVQTTITLGNITTERIPVDKGLKQGCPLSPILFALYIRDLGIQLEQTNKGAKIGKISIPGIFFADDMVLLSDSEEGLQTLLDTTATFGQMKDLTFNGGKSKIMVNWRQRSEKTWRMGDTTITEGNSYDMAITETTDYKYLGVEIQMRGPIFKKQEETMITKAKQRVGIIKNESRECSNPTVIGHKLWETVGLPGILSGMEITTTTKTTDEILQRQQNKLGRKILSLSPYASKEILEGELGWWTIPEWMALIKLRYLQHIDRRPDNTWVKQIALHTHNKPLQQETSWWKEIRRIIEKYNINTTAMKNDKKQWNSYIKEQIEKVSQREWKNNLQKKAHLGIYGHKENRGLSIATTNNVQDRILIKFWANDLEDQATLAEGIHTPRRCDQCPTKERQTAEHIVLECEKYETERHVFLQNIKRKWSPEKWAEWENQSTSIQLAEILGVNDTEGSTRQIARKFTMKVWQRLINQKQENERFGEAKTTDNTRQTLTPNIKKRNTIKKTAKSTRTTYNKQQTKRRSGKQNPQIMRNEMPKAKRKRRQGRDDQKQKRQRTK